VVKTIFKIIALVLLVGYLLVAGFIYGFWRDEPCYRGIKIVVDYPSDEAHFVTETEIRQLVTQKPGFKYKGEPFDAVNTLELSQYIEEHNRLVRHASCYHTPDSLLRIDIEQRNPIIRVKSSISINDATGHPRSDFFIDRDGDIMPALTGTAIHLPIVTGFVHADDIAPLHEFALFLKDESFWSDFITQIYYCENGDVELIPRIGDHRILLGPLDDYKNKLNHVRTFYDEVLPRVGWNAYSVINVKFNGQVVGVK